MPSTAKASHHDGFPGQPEKLTELMRVFKEYWLENDRLSDEKPGLSATY